MRSRLAFIAGVMLLTAFASCRKDSLGADDYIKYIDSRDNGTVSEKKIEGLGFRLTYCPTEYILLKELKSLDVPGDLLQQRKKENDSTMFFHLRIMSDGDNDVIRRGIYNDQDYLARAEYMAYGMEEDIALVNGDDTIFPSVFHFERTYGVSPYADFMIAFESSVPAAGGSFQVLIDDKVFRTGIIKFNYDTKDIQNIPSLKTN